MRVVFMGTPEFAVAVLRQIVEAGWDVAAAYTQPDKPKNRGMKLVPTPVKEYALTQNIPVYQPQSCRAEAVLEEIEKAEEDFEKARFQGFSETEIRQFCAMESRIQDNARKILQNGSVFSGDGMPGE